MLKALTKSSMTLSLLKIPRLRLGEATIPVKLHNKLLLNARTWTARVVVTTTAFFLALGFVFAQTQSGGVRVKGRVTGIPADGPEGWLRVNLTNANGEFETSVRPDGSFEFENVAPGRAALMTSLVRSEPGIVNVETQNADGIVLGAIAPQLYGRVTVDGGRRLPISEDNLSGVVHLEVRDSNDRKVVQQFVRSDGIFGFPTLPPGEYRFQFPRLPREYTVKSIAYAGADLLKTPLKVTGTEPLSFVHIVLTPGADTAPVRGDATLVVSKRGRGPMYAEGSLHYFKMRSKAPGSFRAERRLGGEWYSERSGYQPAGAVGADSLAISLAAGDYELESYVLVCDGNCGRLGGPQDVCRAEFTIKSGETLFAERIQSSPVSRDRSCKLTVSTDPPK
jgi:hypothetical protein